MAGRVADEWEKFHVAVIRNDPPPNVLLSMKMAFYAGVTILERMLVDLSAGDETTEADIQMLGDIVIEVKEFAAEMTNMQRMSTN